MGCCREESEEVSKHDHILSGGFDQYGGTPLDRSPQNELHLFQSSIAEKIDVLESCVGVNSDMLRSLLQRIRTVNNVIRHGVETCELYVGQDGHHVIELSKETIMTIKQVVDVHVCVLVY